MRTRSRADSTNADDTPLPVLGPGRGRTEARNCYSEDQAREIGRTLREARLARHMDLAGLTECTFTRPGDLEALERGEFDRLAGRIHLPVFLRVYGDHLRLDGEELARPRAASVGHPAPAPGPKPHHGRSGGSRRRAAAMVAASLLLGAAGAGYHASHRPGPGAAEATAEAAPPAAAPRPDGGTGRTDDTRPAAPASAPGPAAVPGGSEPPAGGAAGQEPAATASPAVAELPVAEVGPPVPQAEPSSGGTSAAAAEPQAPEGSGGPAPDVAPAAEELEASGEQAPLGAPVPPGAAAGPTSAPSVRAEAAPPAGRFAIYFLSVRPPARVSSTWRRLAERHPALAGLEPRPTRPVDIPGEGTLYTVEAGAFATRAEAQVVCDRLRSRGQFCKVLVP